jgi:hypothetical protein
MDVMWLTVSPLLLCGLQGQGNGRSVRDRLEQKARIALNNDFLYFLLVNKKGWNRSRTEQNTALNSLLVHLVKARQESVPAS